MRKHLIAITETPNFENIDQLDLVADYIKENFSKYSDSVSVQEFTVDGQIYKNVIASFEIENKKRIIVGAHYDACGNQYGALEPPPYFRTENMESYIYSKHLKDNNVDVFGMVSVEMIGYFDDKPNSQNYPIDLLSWFYGDRCDFITVVKTFNAGKFANEFNKLYKKSGKINTQTFIAPKLLHGINYLDHLNYWKFGHSTFMITNTSFFRNKN